MSATAIAQTILDGFDLHYWLFREYGLKAREHFERGERDAVWATSRAQIQMYDLRVAESVEAVLQRFPEAGRDESLWAEIKLAYIRLLYQHLQPECAETFFNSVACRVLHRRYYNNQYIFFRPAVSTEHLEGDEPSYRSYDPRALGPRAALRQILADLRVELPPEALRSGLRELLRAARRRLSQVALPATPLVQVLASLFVRGHQAFVIGRLGNTGEHPFALPLTRGDDGRLRLGAPLLDPEPVAALFNLARAYFLVDMEVPAAYVAFLSRLMPRKPKAELYTAIGLQKQGKNYFYRDLHDHLKHSTDRFVVAPGTPGMVMTVFTLPSFPFVFKLIRDEFAPPKEVSAAEVRAKYHMVKLHDRVGRMADTLEYSDVAFPIARFDPELLRTLERLARGKLERDGKLLVFRHLYIEQRMVPLDIYLQGVQGDEARTRHAIQEFGDAIRDLATVNIFPGDLLPKNFGVTSQGRVVFYDYDELCYLRDCRFRRIPPPRCYEDELAAEPTYGVGPSDVFPEQFVTFLFPPGRARELFQELHGDLTDADFWIAAQRSAAAL